MESRGSQWTMKFCPTRLSARCALLVTLTALLLAAVAPFAWQLNGREGLIAACLGAGICLFASAGAIAMSELFRGPHNALAAVLSGMLVRMAVPLIFVMIVYLRSNVLAEAGLVFYVLLFYLVTLAVETWMALAQVEMSRGGSRKV